MRRTDEEISVDLFAGGGGVSDGYKIATGKEIDVAVNHDVAAVAMHKANHPGTLHYCESIHDVDPIKACQGRKVGFFWISPMCTHFANAKGGTPVDPKIRALAWVEVKWALAVRPRVMFLENVVEFKTWGPVDEKGQPIKERSGETFEAFVAALTTGLHPDHPAWPEIEEELGAYFDKERLVQGLGYTVEYRELVASVLGAPTSRRRFFMIARCDGKPIKWPVPTHGDPKSLEVAAGKLKPWRTAAEVIDFTRPCPSIFASKSEIKEKYGLTAVRPLAPDTMKRTIKGVDKFFVKNPEPFLIHINHSGDSFRGQSINKPFPTITAKHGYGMAAPVLMQYHASDDARGQDVNKPLMTIDASPRYAITAAFLAKYYGKGIGQKIDEPLHTIASHDHSGLNVVHIVKFKGDNKGQTVDTPLQTITASIGQFGVIKTFLQKVKDDDMKYWPQVRELFNEHCGYGIADDEVLLFEINGDQYFICDIGLRMLTPRELFDGNGFRPTYIIDTDYYGKRYPKAEQVKRCGNSVPPPFATALIWANMPEICMKIDDWDEWDKKHQERQMSLF